MTKWGSFRDFLNKQELGWKFVLSDLYTKEELKHINRGTISGYISWLRRAKFVERSKSGVYTLTNHMPETLTMWNCKTLLEGDNLTYIEDIQRQKDKKIVRVKYTAERNEVIKPILAELYKTLNVIKQFPYAYYDIDLSGIGAQIRDLTYELTKERNPTKAWLNMKAAKP